MILTSEAALTAISTSRIEASLALGRTSLGVVEAAPDLCWSISGIPVASFNAVVRYRIGPDPDRKIDDVQRQFAARAMPFGFRKRGVSRMALNLASVPRVRRSGPRR